MPTAVSVQRVPADQGRPYDGAPNYRNYDIVNEDDELIIIDGNPNLVNRPWHYGLCTNCGDCDSFLEAWCCPYCQLSRQFNMLYYLKPHINVPVCLLLWLGDTAFGSIVSTLFACALRRDIRRRYRIEGGTCSDMCTTCFCTPCAVQQQLLEMTSLGAFPGAFCYESSVFEAQMI